MSGPSVYGSEPSAAAVFACLRALVTTQAATHAAWQDFAVAFLAPETEAFIAARLSAAAEVGGGDDSAPPSKKKRKRAGGAGAGECEAVAVKTCEHCHGDIPEVTLRVAMLDGTTFGVTVPERGCVREVKRQIAEVRAPLLSHAGVLGTLTVVYNHAVARPACRADGSVRPRH
jgi:hypothetical protein